MVVSKSEPKNGVPSLIEDDLYLLLFVSRCVSDRLEIIAQGAL
jgi:hypothetical protein